MPEEGLEPSHLAATASKTVVSTIPPSGQINLDLFICVVHPSRVSHRFTDARTREYGSHASQGRTPRVLPIFASLRKGRTSTIPPSGQILSKNYELLTTNNFHS